MENIHSKILEAVGDGENLEMGSWHCGTSHCRAGWVVTLAGEPGLKLESKTSTEFAAMMILKESSEIRVSPAKFYVDNESAMIDIKRCAELEKEASK